MSVEELCEMLDQQIRQLDSLPNEETREQMFAILQLIDQVHRGGIQKIVENFKDSASWQKLCTQPEVEVLMRLYGLNEVDDVELVEQTLDMVRPYIESHGGKLEMLKVDQGRVHVRLSGACENCSGTEATIKNGIESALKEAYPDFEQLVVENVTESRPPKNLVQLKANAPVFQDLIRLDQLTELKPTLIDLGDRSLVLARFGNEVSCFDPGCAACGGSFKHGQVRGHIVMCERANCAFDLRTGRQVDGGNVSLQIYPISIQDGNIAVAINVKPVTMLGTS